MYMKLHEHLDFHDPMCTVCSNVYKHCSVHANTNKGNILIHYEGNIYTLPIRGYQ